MKRMARLSLTAPPASILVALALIYNLLKRHPSCMCLIHRETSIAESEPLDMAEHQHDPYMDEEKDPSLSRAIDSSLWELMTLKNHYCSQVAKMAKIFEKPFTRPEFLIQDFLKGSYTSVSIEV
jgi:U3 small nucleolar RNA-associated protein 19